MLRLAILDMYGGHPNQGMRAIKEIVQTFEGELEWQVFDVRSKCELPDTGFDIYISTGGPGHPLVGDGIWDHKYYAFIDQLWKWNKKGQQPKKYVFFICHSFQMACHYFGLGKVTDRYSRSFGIFPTHMTEEGKKEPFFQELPNPFWIADFRHYQVVEPDQVIIAHNNFKILTIEKNRPYIKRERAIMSVRFSDEFFGTQFHPEADPKGMLVHFQKEEEKQEVIEKFGIEKYEDMMAHLNDPDKIRLTHNVILPTFLNNSINSLKSAMIDV